MELMEQISESLQKGDAPAVDRLTRDALEQGTAPGQILDDGLLVGMAVIGQKFKAHEVFLPHVLLAAKAMYAGLDILGPLMEGDERLSRGKVVIGTVQGDIHDIGKNLVGIMLRGAGYEVIDLGKDVAPARFIDVAIEEDAQFVGLSTLLTTTRPVMKQVIELARERGIYDKVRILVGGAPLNRAYAEEIGAHAYCFDGMNAVDCVNGFMNRS